MFNRFWRPYVPGFRVRPHDDVPGFNIDENGLPRRESAWFDGEPPSWATQPYLGAAQPERPYSLSLPAAGLAGIVQSDPSSGLAGFRVDPQDDVPGFNVRAGDDVPGVNLNEDVDRQKTILSAPTPLPDVEEPAQLPSLQFPEWVYKLVTMLPQLLTPSGPITGQHIAINSPPSLPPTEPPIAKRWPPLEMLHRSASASIGSLGGSTQSTGPQPVDQSAMSKAWPQPRHDGWPYTRPPRFPHPWSVNTISQSRSFPPMFEPRPVGGSNFTLVNTPGGGGQPVQQGTPPPHHQRMQPSSTIGAAPPRSDGPSVGQRLLQSTVDTVIPGAYYQKLAREQFGAGNYIGGGVYQGAALLDAGLGVATLGLSAPIAAGLRSVARRGADLFRRAFDSRSQLSRYLGPAPKGMQWHHIVEQSQAAQFGQRRIQSVDNVVAIPIEAHQRLSALYSSKQPYSDPQTVREWLRRQSFQVQYEFGLKELKRVLGY